MNWPSLAARNRVGDSLQPVRHPFPALISFRQSIIQMRQKFRGLARILRVVVQKQIVLRTPAHGAMFDLTDNVAALVAEAGVQTGIAHIFTVGSTAAVGTIEFEPGLKRDLPQLLDRLIPPSSSYGHE